MRQRLGRQEGQAMIIVLAFMLLAIPVTIGALEHAGGLARDSAVKTRILKRGNSSLGAQQYSLHQLLAPGGGTTTITLNDSTVTTTVTKLDTPPALLPIYALKGRLNASKIVSPTSVSSSATTTYTITITNNKNEPMTPEKIQDEIPGGFSYLTSTSVMRDSSGTIVSTANPSKQIHLLVWTVPSSVSLDPGATMTLSFAATATSTPGLYCNEAFVIPGGEETSSGKTAELTVGTTSASGCRGGLVPVTKTVTPAMVSSNTTTTYTFVITIVNKGEVTVNVKEIKDVTSDGFVYEPGSATSSSSIPPQFVAGEPTTDILKNEIVWAFGGVGEELATSTTWTVTFQAEANLTRGFYPNTVDMQFAGSPLPTPSQEDYCRFEDASLTITSGETLNCGVGSNGDVILEKGAQVTGDVVSLSGDIVLGQAVLIGGATIDGDILASGTVTLEKGSHIKGNVVTGGDFILAQDVTIDGFVWASGNIIVDKDATFGGDLISGGTVTLDQDSTVTGDVWAVGSVTLGTGAAVSGTINANSTEIPADAPIDLESTGTTAVVTAVDIYRITTTSTDGDTETTTTCEVYVADDIDLGTFGTVENCTTQ